jgi:hypothetical protein
MAKNWWAPSSKPAILRVFYIGTNTLESTEFQPVSQPGFGDLHGQVIALPGTQGVAQQFLNFLPLPQGQ